MFNVCRRGYAPLSRISRAAASSSLSLARKPILPLNAGILQQTTSSLRLFHSLDVRYNAAAADQQSTPLATIADQQTAISEYYTEFKALASNRLVHENIIRQITDFMKYETMSEVQSMTINKALGGQDM